MMIIVSGSIAIVVTGVQLYLDYKQDIQILEDRLDSVESSYRGAITRAVFDLNHEYLRILAQGILKLPSVNYLAVTGAQDITIFSGGERQKGKTIKRILPLSVDTRNAAEFKIGELRIEADLQMIIDRQAGRFIVIFLSNIIKTLLVSFIILAFLQRHLVGPLGKVTSHLNNRSEEILYQPLSIRNNNVHAHKNELDDLVIGINAMKRTIKEKVDIIAQTNRDLELIVKEQTKELNQAFEKKSTLLRMVCHDLAQPLAIISAGSELLQGDLDQLQQKTITRIASKISKAVDMGSDIISQLRQLEALQSGKERLELSPITTETVLEFIHFLFDEKLLDKNINLITNIETEAAVLAEKTSFLNQIIANIFSNAIKFSNYGEPITFSIRELPSQWLEISIRDKGIGIPSDLLPKLFDYQGQTNRRGTNGEKGTGFGMPIVKAFVNAIGGEIRVESKTPEELPENHGTTVHIVLPKAEQNITELSA